MAEQSNKNKPNEAENNSKIKMRQSVKYLSVEQCAELLGLSKSTVYQMLRKGRIEGAFRINRAWRIPMMQKTTINQNA